MKLPADSSYPDLRGQKVLIVDDDRLNSRILAGFFRFVDRHNLLPSLTTIEEIEAPTSSERAA